MEIKFNFNAKEMNAIKKAIEAYDGKFVREDHYIVEGPMRFCVNHVDGEATVTIASNDDFFCDILGIATRNAGFIKSMLTTAKGLFEMAKSTINVMEGELKATCEKYKAPRTSAKVAVVEDFEPLKKAA